METKIDATASAIVLLLQGAKEDDFAHINLHISLICEKIRPK